MEAGLERVRVALCRACQIGNSMPITGCNKAYGQSVQCHRCAAPLSVDRAMIIAVTFACHQAFDQYGLVRAITSTSSRRRLNLAAVQLPTPERPS